MKKQYHLILYWIILLLSPIYVNAEIAIAQSMVDKPSIFDDLHFKELLEVDLEMDLAALFSDRKNIEKHKAVFSYQNKKGLFRNWNIKVAQRGKFRRSKCENLPPIKFYFDKKELKKAGLAKFDDLKVVTYCVNDFELAKQLLVKEYLAYKMYNQLTEESFRVQFLKINYQDVVSGNVISQFAFLIEDLAELRSRVGAKNKKETNAFLDFKYDDERRKLVLYFQYMIGNTDWSIAGSRNVKILLRNETGFIVPYDFDFAKMVNAPYAIKNDKNETIKRIYLGTKKDADDLLPVVFLFLFKKDKILKTIRRCRLLKRKERRELIQFIEDFYKKIGEINVPKSFIEE